MHDEAISTMKGKKGRDLSKVKERKAQSRCPVCPRSMNGDPREIERFHIGKIKKEKFRSTITNDQHLAL